MPTILDLPGEIHLLVGEQLSSKVLYSCIRVCRSFYSAYIHSLWSNILIRRFKSNAVISADQLRANAHRVKTINYSSTLTDDYYTIVYPRLREIRLCTYYTDKKDPSYLQVESHQIVQFARLHSTIKTLQHDQPKMLSKEFWEVVETEWKEFESLDLSGVVVEDAVDVFWRVCDRLKSLSLAGVSLPKDLPTLSTLSFPHLQRLSVTQYFWVKDVPYQNWPLQLLEQVKKSDGLRHLDWDVADVPFPARMVTDAFEEGCWPELCEVSIGVSICLDQDLATVLRMLPSQRLTHFDHKHGALGPLTHDCLRKLYYGHLQELRIGQCTRVTSAMTQELLTECVHLVYFDAPHIFVRDIATAPKPWGCSKLVNLVIFIAKQKGDEEEWEGKVFEQISKLGRLQSLDLQRFPHVLYRSIRPNAIFCLQTLDFRLSPSSNTEEFNGFGDEDNVGSNSSNSSSNSSSGGHLPCLSSLVQLKYLTFDGAQQTLGMEEALWMTEHWRDLRWICGEFKGVKGDDVDKLEKLFLKKGVMYTKS